MARYLIANGAAQTAAAFAVVTTGATIKTMMQVVPKVSGCRIIEWGISFDGSAAATPGKVELIETDVGATITQYASADFAKQDAESLLAPSNPSTNLFDVSAVTKSGYTSSGEGTVGSARNLDAPQLIAPSNQFIKQFPLGREPLIQLGLFARIRVTFGTAVNAYCYMIVDI